MGSDCLRRWHCRSVCRDDLRLKCKYFTALRVDQHLQPIHVVVAVGLVVAKRLYPREVLKSAALGIQKRLVNAKVVGVSVDIRYRLSERHDLIAKRGEKPL